jgi:V/A-type H+/Na+-transporting ATPase subunit K
MIEGLGDMGASVALAAVGSGLGAGVAGMAAIGSWKKCYAQNKAAPFIMLAFVGAPLTQTIYGMILRNAIKAANMGAESYKWQLVYGIFGGLALGVSAWYQGKAGASASDAFAETGKGFAQNMIVLGIIESVAIFVLIFLMAALPKA